MSAIYLKRFNYSVSTLIDTLRIDIMQPKYEIIRRKECSNSRSSCSIRSCFAPIVLGSLLRPFNLFSEIRNRWANQPCEED